jgi:hypothetical protein
LVRWDDGRIGNAGGCANWRWDFFIADGFLSLLLVIIEISNLEYMILFVFSDYSNRKQIEHI